MVPWLLAASIVGLSLFQHTALMKKDVTSSSASSTSGEPNLCQVTGFEIAWKSQVIVNLLKFSLKRNQNELIFICSPSKEGVVWRDDADLVVDKNLIGFTAARNEFVVHRETDKIFLICMPSKYTNLQDQLQTLWENVTPVMIKTAETSPGIGGSTATCERFYHLRKCTYRWIIFYIP